MDRLEQLVHDTLAEHAADAPTALPARGRHSRRTWWAAGAAAAVVVVVAVGVSALQSRPSSAPVTGSSVHPSAVPSGYKLVSYHGIEFAVPQAMSVAHAHSCGYLWPDGVEALDPRMVTSCPPGGNPKPRAGATYIEAVPAGGPAAKATSGLATKSTTVAGAPARAGYGTRTDYPGVTGVLILTDPAVQLTVTAPTRAEVATVLDSVRPAPVDAVGCPSREPSVSGHADYSSLAPSGATAITLCGYAGFSTNPRSDYWLLGSAAVPTDRVTALLAQLNALPAVAHPNLRALHDYLRVRYPDGQVRWLSMGMVENGSDLVFTDGQHSRLARNGSAVWKLLYPGSGWPESVFAEPSPSGRPTSNHPTTPSHPSTSSATVPSGYRLVGYKGIEIAVPESLPVRHSPCGPPVNAVYAANGATYSCPAAPPGRTTTLPKTAVGVWLGASVSAAISTTEEHTGHRTVAGVAVTVTAPTESQVDTILDSIRTASVDPNGCPMRLDSLTPRNATADEMVPGKPVSAVWCDYVQATTDSGGSLVGSAAVPAADLAPLVAGFDAMKADKTVYVPTLDLPKAQHTQTVFRYTDGSTRTVDEITDVSPAPVTDGQRYADDNANLITQLRVADGH